MKKSLKNTIILISIGILIIISAQIVTRYNIIPEFFNGALIGVGAGTILIGILSNTIKTA